MDEEDDLFEDDPDPGSGSNFSLGFGEPSDDRLWSPPESNDVSVEDPTRRTWSPSRVSPLSLPSPLAYLNPVALVVTDTDPVAISFKFPGAEPFTIAVYESDYPALARAFTQCIAYALAESERRARPRPQSVPFRES